MRVSYRFCFYVNVEHLTDIDWKVTLLKVVEDLQYSSIHPFDGLSCEGTLGNNVRLYTEERQRKMDPTVTPHESSCRSSRFIPPCIILINIDPDLEGE